MICELQGRWGYRFQGCHKIPGPPLHLLLASTKTCTHQSRRQKMTLDKVSLCKLRWIFFWFSGFFLVVFLRSVIQLTCLVHTKRQFCYFLGLLPSTLAAILCSVFIPLFQTGDMPPWSSSDTTLVTLFDGDLNHVVLCLTGVRRLYDSDQFHPLSHDWYKQGVHSLSWFLGFYCMLAHSPSWHLSFLPACHKSRWHNDKRHTWKKYRNNLLILRISEIHMCRSKEKAFILSNLLWSSEQAHCPWSTGTIILISHYCHVAGKQ